MPAAAPDDEDALIALAAAGDHAAFAVLVRRHGPRLARTVRALGTAPGDVEDVVQDAFVAAWRNLLTFKPGMSFAGWASVIALNKARDWGRKRRWRSLLPIGEAAEAQLAEDGVAIADGRAELQQLLRRLSRLPEAQRTALMLTAVAGLSYGDAAGVLSVTQKAVELRVARARKALAE